MDGRPRNPPTRPLVLIVDPQEDTRAMYGLMLSMSGFDVVVTSDGVEGLRRALEVSPDVIVTDLPVPNYDGRAFLRELQDDPRTRDTPVVAVSGRLQRSLRERVEQDGFAACFPKPLMPYELAAGLREILDGNGHATSSRRDLDSWSAAVPIVHRVRRRSDGTI